MIYVWFNSLIGIWKTFWNLIYTGVKESISAGSPIIISLSIFNRHWPSFLCYLLCFLFVGLVPFADIRQKPDGTRCTRYRCEEGAFSPELARACSRGPHIKAILSRSLAFDKSRVVTGTFARGGAFSPRAYLKLHLEVIKLSKIVYKYFGNCSANPT